MKTIKKKLFNMVELSLAIAIVAIGLTTVVTLVPISMNNGSNTKASYYTSDIADSVNAYVTRTLASDFELLRDLPESKPSTILSNTDGWTATGEGNIYAVNGVEDGIYGIKMASGDQNDINDILGEVRIWRDRVGNTTIGNNDTVDMKTNSLAAVNVEVSIPLSKPYSERKKHKYYFEVFNQDSTIRTMQEEDFITLLNSGDGEGEDTVLERDNGEITVTSTGKKIKISIIASELCSTSTGYHVPVYVRINIQLPNDANLEGTTYEMFKGTRCLVRRYYEIESNYGTYANSPTEIEIVALPGDTYEIDVPEGTTFKIWAAYWEYRYKSSYAIARYYLSYGSITDSGNSYIDNQFWSTNENQVLTLINGDTPPEFSCNGLQLTPEQCIQEYINENGLVTLNDNQVLYLFELTHTNRSNSGFNMQDMIVLAEIIND